MKKKHLTLSFSDRFARKAWCFVEALHLRAQSIENRVMLSRLGSCGKGVAFYGCVHLSSPEEMIVGNNVHIGDNARIRAEGGLTIGDNCHISRNLVLYTINHRYGGDRLPYDENFVKKSVVIGRNVWIGMNVCIAPGTRIGDGAIIGMGSVVFGEVAPLSIVGSPQWRVLGYRDKEHYDGLENEMAYGGPNGTYFSIDCKD